MTPTEDEFLIWAENPITQWVLSGVQRYAGLQKQAFSDGMWMASGEQADWEAQRLLHARARARQDAYEGFAALTYDQACGLHEEASDGQDPA